MTTRTTWDPSKATIQSDGNPDTPIVPYVESLNAHGIETYQSCSGHVHSDGTRSDGLLWIAPDALTEPQARELAESDSGIYGVCRRYARNECWEITFIGMAHEDAGEESLECAMGSLFGVVGVPMP